MGKEEAAKRSVVVLLAEWPALTNDEVVARVERSFGPPEAQGPEAEAWCRPVAQMGWYMLRTQGVTMTLYLRPAPYFDDPAGVARCIEGDPDLAQFVRHHRAFVSADSLGSDRSQATEYEVLCRLANEFVLPGDGAIFVPEMATLVALTPERRQAMQAAPGLVGLGFAE